MSPIETDSCGGRSQHTSETTPLIPTSCAASACISALNRPLMSQKVVVPLRTISRQARTAERYASSSVRFSQ